MTLRFLLDENVDPDVERQLERAGHDAVHTQDVEALGRGSDDHEVAAHARRTDRHVLTNDDDLYAAVDDECPTLFFFPEQRLSPHRIASIVEAIDDQFSDGGLDEQPVVMVVEGWLSES